MFFYNHLESFPDCPTPNGKGLKFSHFFGAGHLANYECGFEIIFWVALGSNKNGKDSQKKMQDVGNGHALKKGMKPNLRTIDHLPSNICAKKI